MSLRLKMIIPMFLFALSGCEKRAVVPEEDGSTEQLERLPEEELRLLLIAFHAEKKEDKGEIRAVQSNDPLLNKLKLTK